jgi:hypothetical protein
LLENGAAGPTGCAQKKDLHVRFLSNSYSYSYSYSYFFFLLMSQSISE